MNINSRKLTYLAIHEIKPNPRNPRKHTDTQVRAIANSITAFGFNAPILVDRQNQVIVGHGRLEGAKLAGLQQVPVICLEDLSEAQAKAYMLADNKLTDRSTWDDHSVAVHLKELSELCLDFDIEATGFEMPEIDIHIQSLGASDDADPADSFEVASGQAISRIGDLWILGKHKVYCGSALDPEAYIKLFPAESASAVFTDPPYNLRVDGMISGKGETRHREFPMASGEMTRNEFTHFLTTSFQCAQRHCKPGALFYACMDFRHMQEILSAGRTCEFDLLNLCVWVKTNGGMGALYRSQHELVFVFRNGKSQHRNNVQLGRFGRNRTNVWTYAGANCPSKKGDENHLKLHPTVKPLALVSDAILDSTARGEFVLDPFLGSGTTILAAEKTGRTAYGMELDPLYVDTIVKRWARLTEKRPMHETGKTFEEIAGERKASL